MQIAARAAKSDATVLLCGESGTGKELFAKLVWEESERAGKKFLPVHSGAIEPNLLASALFGHEKGAFTGAVAQKKGLFEEADGGTIFLDEIGEINPETQVKLLRVLQEGEFMRVGGAEPIKVDVRVICATNRDLKKAVQEGRFREDLYYRLNVIKIKLPPLRERTGDIEDLVRHYVKQLGGPLKRMSPEAMAAMVRYNWPGNVRELRNMVERMTVLSLRDELGVEDLPEEIRDYQPEKDESPTDSGGGTGTGGVGVGTRATTGLGASFAGAEAVGAARAAVGRGADMTLGEMERMLIENTLAKCAGNKKKAADMMGISRSAFYEKLKRYGIENGGVAT